jgi:glutathione S-transferase
MQLYFSPLACSMATRISLYEAEAQARYVEVDPDTKHLPNGDDYRAISPLGLVPALQLDDGSVLTESAAILQYVADRFPGAGLVPTSPLERTRLQQWLSFIGTELHKALFVPLLGDKTPPGAREYALEKGGSKLALLDTHLADRQFLLGRFSVADAYLFTVLTWSMATPVDLKQYPALSAYQVRLRGRPSIARALAEESLLYAQAQARRRKSA